MSLFPNFNIFNKNSVTKEPNGRPWGSTVDNVNSNAKINIPVIFVDDEEEIKKQKELEEKLEGKITDLDAILGSLDLDVIFDDETLYREQIVDGDAKLKKIVNKWDELFKRYDEKGEKTLELSVELDECKKELDNFLEEIEKNKLEKKANDDFLNEPKNRDWEDQFRKASACIVEEFADMSDFNAKKPGIVIGDVDKDFAFDLRKALLESADLPAAKKDPFGLVGKKKWIEIFAAARMINDSRTPKKFILVGGQTYAMPDAKKPKTFDKEDIKKARESLNRVVIERLQKKFEENEIHDISGNLLWGNNVRMADLRYLAFEILKDVLEDRNNLGIVLNEGVDSPLLDDEKKKMDVAIADIFKENNNKEANKLAVRVYVYNKIGSAIAKSDKAKSLTNEEKYIKNRELVDGVLQSFDQDLQAKISSFIDQREQVNSKGIVLAKEQRKAIEDAVIKYVDENILITKSVSTVDPNISAVTPSVVASPDVVANPVDDLKKAADQEKAKKAEEKRLKAEEKKNEKEMAAGLFAELQSELKTFSLETFQEWYNGFNRIADENNISGKDKKELVAEKMIEDMKTVIEKHASRKTEEAEKIAKYILTQLK